MCEKVQNAHSHKHTIGAQKYAEQKCVIREYPHHYQVFFRVEKPSKKALMPKHLFSTCVNILTKLLLLK